MKSRWLPFIFQGMFRRNRIRHGRSKQFHTIERLESREMLSAVTWVTNNDGFWDDGANWSTGQIPGNTDDVTIDRGEFNPVITIRDNRNVNSIISRESLVVSNGTFQVNTASQIDASTLTLDGGTVSSFGPLTVTNTGRLEWEAGGITGGGLVNQGVFSISGSADKEMSGVLVNQGTVIHSGSGDVIEVGGQPSRIENESGAVYDFQGDGGQVRIANFNNHGIVRKSAGTGESRFLDRLGNPDGGVNFNNLGGTIDVQVGTLRLATGTSTGGTYNAAAGAVLDFAGGGTAAVSGAYTGSGGGRVELSNGTIRTVGGSAGPGATFNFPVGLFHWTGGGISFDGAPLTNAGTLQISGTADKSLAARIVNQGTIVHSGSGDVVEVGGQASRIENQTGAVYDFQGDDGQVRISQFDNQGLVRKSVGAGESRFLDYLGNPDGGVNFNNLGGTIDVQVGTLRLAKGTSTGGTYNAAAGAVLDFAGGGTASVSGTYTGSGGGRVELSNGTIRTVGGSAGPGATFNFPVGLFHWTGGGISFDGAPLTNAGTLQISGAADKSIAARIVNQGAIVHSGSGDVVEVGGQASRIENQPGAVYDFQGDDGQVRISQFDNQGLVRKSAGPGESRFLDYLGNPDGGVNFNNLGGTIDVQVGTLRLAKGTSTGGTYNAATGAVLDFAGGGTASVSGTYTGSGGGRVELSSGIIRTVGGIAGPGTTFDFPVGYFHWTGGGISYDGAALTNVGTLQISGSADKTIAGIFINQGTIVHSGSGDILDVASQGTRFENQAGALYDFQGDDGQVRITNFNNDGVVRKSSGTGESRFFDGTGTPFGNFNFNNLGGTVEVQVGTVRLSRGTSTGGTYNVAAGAVLDLAGGGSATLEGTYTGSGAGRVEFSSGTILTDTVGATLNFAAGLLHWTGGSIIGSGTPLTNQGSMTISGSNARTIRGTGFVNNGTVTHSGSGDLELFASSTFVNNGLYDLQSDADFVVPLFAFGGSGSFINSPTGVFRKSVGLGITSFRRGGIDNDVIFNNTGTVDIRSGTLEFTRPVEQFQGATLTAGEWIVGPFSAITSPNATNITTNLGRVTLDGTGSSFALINTLATNAGSFTLAGGRDFTTVGDLTSSGQLTVGPGSTLTVNGTLTEAQAADNLVSWWRGEGTANASAGTVNGVLNGNASFADGESGLAFSFDGTRDYVSLGNPAALQLQDFTISTWVKRDRTNQGGLLFAYGQSGYGLGIKADGKLFLTQLDFSEVTTSNLRITDTDFHHVAVTKSGSLVTFYVDGVAEVVAPYSPTFNFFTSAAIGARADNGNSDFAGRIDEMAIFNRPLTAEEINTLRDDNNPSAIGNPPPTINIGIEGTSASQQFGRIAVSGAANFAGRLNVQLAGGFGPALPDQYSILSYASRTGTFFPATGLDPFFDITIDPTQTVLEVVASAADIQVLAVDVPASALPGDLIAIQYTVHNLDTINIVGNWFDSIYLSLDDKYDANDPLIGRVEHSGGLGALGSYSATLNAMLPGVVDGNYRVIVIADSRGHIADSNRANNKRASDNAISVTLPVLPFDVLTPLTINTNEDIYLRLNIPVGGDVLITANFPNALQGEVYIRQGALPTRSEFDFVAPMSSDLDRTITLQSPLADTYYVLIHGREGAAGGVGFNLLAEHIAFDLQTVSPGRGSNRGSATTVLTGAGFTANTVVELLNGSGNPVATATTRLISQNKLYATFNLVGTATGTYTVRASQPGFSDTLPAAYQVVVGEPGDVRVEIVTAGSLRPGRLYTGYIDYQNIGDTDVVPPLIFVVSDNPLAFDLATNPSETEHRFLAISPEGPAGILAPGQSVRVPFRFYGNTFHIEALTMSPDETAPMDWEALRTAIRPDNPPANWDAIYNERFVGAGSTVGDYVRLLADAATLYQLHEGQTTSDPDALHGFIMAEGFADHGAVIRGHLFRDTLDRPAGRSVVSAINRETGAVQATVATADGLVRIGNLPPGTYDIVFENFIPPENLAPVVVPAVGAPLDQTWIVRTGGRIIGRVGVPDGVVLSDLPHGILATVIATDAAGNRYTAGVGADRVYQFTGLPAGTYDLSFSTATTLPVTVHEVDVIEGGSTGLVDLFSAAGGAISGTVRDADTNLPVANVTVSILNDLDNPRSAVTDASGHYLLQGVTPGTVSVSVISTGLFSEPQSNIAVTANGTTAGIDLNVDYNLLGTITGTVTLGGSPLVGAVVELLEGDVVISGTVTQAGGQYVLSDVPPGNYSLRVDDFNASPVTQSITLTANQDLVTDFNLTQGGRIHGVLTHSTGTQSTVAPQIRLAVLDPSGNLIPVLTNDAGEFEVGHLGMGTYVLMLADGSHRQSFEITSNNQDLELNFQLNTGLLVGRLLGHDGALPAGDVIIGLLANDQLVATSLTLSTGYFALPYLEPGTYELVFDAADEFFPRISNIVITAGGAVDLGDIIPQSASLNLSLTDTLGNNIDADGIVFLTRADDPLEHSIALRHTAPGSQSFTGLVPGTYLVQAGLAGFAYKQSTITLQAGSNTQNLVMEFGAIAEGTVTDSTLAPLEGISVVAYDPANPKIRWEGTTDAQGEYLLSLPAGTYSLLIADLRQGEGITPLAPVTFTNVTVTNHQTLDLDTQLSAGSSSLSGTINSGNSGQQNTAPLGAEVTLLTVAGLPVATVTADEFGAYEFTGLAAGNYQVSVAAPGYSFGLLNVAVVAGPNLGANPQGQWAIPSTSGVIESQPVQTFAKTAMFDSRLNESLNRLTADPANATSLVGSAKQRLMDIFDLLFREPVADSTRHTGVSNIPDDCPEALAAFRKVLQLQLYADEFFVNWQERWDAGRKVFAVNTGLFAVSLAKFASSLYFAKNVIPYSGQLNSLLAKDKALRNGFGNACAAVQNTGDLKALGDILGQVEQVRNALKPAILTAQRLFELKSISLPALAAIPGSSVAAYLGVSTSPTLIDVLNELGNVGHWSTFADVSQTVSTIVGFGGAIVGVLDTIAGVVNAIGPNPAFAPILAVLGPLSDGLSVISSGAQGVRDLLVDAEGVSQFKFAYESAIARRDAAFEAFLDILEACEHDEKKKTDKPNQPRTREQLRSLFLVLSSDPNDIAGPEGSGTPNHFMRVDQNFPYEILFENKPDATAPAQEVVITQQLDSDLDWSSFELGDFGFGDLIVDVPAGRNFYQTRVDLSATKGYFVDFTAGIDLNTGIVTWRFVTIDPLTGDLVDDALAGFLPPNDGTHRGEGFLEYSINPLASLQTGATINAQASIVFDTNAAILTPVYVNKIDTGVPSSTVTALPATQDLATFTVSWSGIDAAAVPAGSGIATFDIYVSDNGAAFVPFLLGTELNSATFTGQINHTYSFYSVATDRVGLRQPTPASGQTSTQVLDLPFDFGDAPDPVLSTSGNYPTLLSHDGARHKLGSGLVLGTVADRELDGQPTTSANGDDVAGTTDDEDGVVLADLIQGTTGSATVTASQAGKLDAWIDFNRDGDWLDAGEQIATSLSLNAGPNNVTFSVPALASLGNSFARFRLSSAGGLAPTGSANDGEVEDYQVPIAAPLLTQPGPAVTFIKKHAAVKVVPQSNVPFSNLTHGILTISVNAVGTARKLFDIFTGFSREAVAALGTSSGPQFAAGRLTLQIQLSATVTSSDIQNFLRAITFTTKGKGLKSPTRTFEITLANAAGASSHVTQLINVRKK